MSATSGEGVGGVVATFRLRARDLDARPTAASALVRELVSGEVLTGAHLGLAHPDLMRVNGPRPEDAFNAVLIVEAFDARVLTTIMPVLRSDVAEMLNCEVRDASIYQLAYLRASTDTSGSIES